MYISVGKSEDLRDKLRSIIAQFEFQHQIEEWENKGIEFRTYLYVPEKHPASGDVFVEREDDAHVLKVSYTYSEIFTCKSTLCACDNLFAENNPAYSMRWS